MQCRCSDKNWNKLHNVRMHVQASTTLNERISKSENNTRCFLCCGTGKTSHLLRNSASRVSKTSPPPPHISKARWLHNRGVALDLAEGLGFHGNQSSPSHNVSIVVGTLVTSQGIKAINDRIGLALVRSNVASKMTCSFLLSSIAFAFLLGFLYSR